MRARVRSLALSMIGGLTPLPRHSVRFLYAHSMEARDKHQFRRTLKMLRNSHDFVTVADAVKLATNGGVDGRYLCFSFDDGFLDNFQLVAPLLDEFRAHACFFVVPGLIDADGATRARILQERMHTSPDRSIMTWEQIRSLHRAGIEIGCHSFQHFDLASLDEADAVADVFRAQGEIQTQLNAACRFFAWPFGHRRHMPVSVIRQLRPSFDAAFSAFRGGTQLSYDGAVINRDHFEPGWPPSHVRYGVARRVRAGTEP